MIVLSLPLLRKRSSRMIRVLQRPALCDSVVLGAMGNHFLVSTKEASVYLVADQNDLHSSLFSAVFANGAVEGVLLAEQGSHTNLNPPTMFQ